MPEKKKFHIEVLVRPVEDNKILTDRYHHSLMTQGHGLGKELIQAVLGEIEELVEYMGVDHIKTTWQDQHISHSSNNN